MLYDVAQYVRVVNQRVWIGALGSWAALRGLIIVSVLARLRPALRP